MRRSSSKPQQKRYRTNHQIRAKEVRLIGPDGEQVGIVPIQEAMTRARELELDLVEVAPEARPPVCKIEDFTKIMYQKKRQAREARKKQKATEVKEVKVRPNTDDHDFGIKMDRAIKFLEKGAKVKVTMMFRGREIATARQRSDVIRDRVMEYLKDHAELESISQTSFRTSTMILAPKKSAKQSKAKEDGEE